MTFLLAGHETTALALSWTWYLLGEHAEVRRRLLREVKEVLGRRAPRLEDLGRLPVVEGVVKEALRLYPPVWVMGRAVAETCEIGGYRFSKGAEVLMSQWVVHRDGRYFESPEAFDPGRWTEARVKGLPGCAFFPFGGGPRSCIGGSFAMMEAVIIVAMVVQRFELELVAGQKVEPVPFLTLRPREGIRFRLREVGI